MIINVLTFEDGRKAYASQGISIAVNKQQPTIIDEITVTDEIHQSFIDNPVNITENLKGGE